MSDGALIYAHVYAALIKDGSTHEHADKVARKAVRSYVNFAEELIAEAENQ